MAKDESRRDRWVKASQRLRNAFQMAAVSCYMMVLFAQPAAAADTMWTRFSTIIADVYGELVGISTIVAVTAAAVALLVRMISRNERAVAEATSWLNRLLPDSRKSKIKPEEDMSVKNKILSLTASLLLLTMLTLPAGAVSLDVTDPDAMLPVDIILDQDNKEIRKVYDLSPNTDPSTLPMGQFERDGLLYDCTDVLREVIIGSETQVITQEEKVDSDKKDMDTILSLLPQEKEVTTEEGFTGTLTLDLDSIKTEAAGYGSSTQPVTATRTYPNLANQDLNHLPKSITEGGRTLTLQDVQWQTDNTYNADDYEIGDRFTAVCTYGGSKTVSYVTGYTTTANYSGEVYRTGVTVIRYTVIFTGTPMEPVAEEQSQSGGLNWLMVALPALAALGAGTGGTYFFMKRKERKMYEELAESNDAAAGHHSDDGDPGTGGGV